MNFGPRQTTPNGELPNLGLSKKDGIAALFRLPLPVASSLAWFFSILALKKDWGFGPRAPWGPGVFFPFPGGANLNFFGGAPFGGTGKFFSSKMELFPRVPQKGGPLKKRLLPRGKGKTEGPPWGHPLPENFSPMA